VPVSSDSVQAWAASVKSASAVALKFARINKADALAGMERDLETHEKEVQKLKDMVRHSVLTKDDLLIEIMSAKIIDQIRDLSDTSKPNKDSSPET